MRDNSSDPEPQLKVGIDVSPMLVGGTGITRYATEVVNGLERRDIDLLAFAVGRGSSTSSMPIRRFRVPRRLTEPLWTRGLLSIDHLVAGADLVHVMSGPPPVTKRPLVVTVHDLAALERPDLWPGRHVRSQQRLLAQLSRARVVIAVSQATADALTEHGVDRSLIVVTPLGLTTLPTPDNGRAHPRPFVLAVGAMGKSKGQSTLVAALAASGVTHDLVIVGWDAGEGAALRALAERHSIGGRIRFAGRVTDRQLSSLYRDAALVAVPSLTEGFGLPVLEACGAGAPVLASDLPATREVGGDAIVYARAGDVADWTAQLARLLGDPDGLARLGRAGPARAASFTWDRTLNETLRAYRQAIR